MALPGNQMTDAVMQFPALDSGGHETEKTDLQSIKLELRLVHQLRHLRNDNSI